jgi:hypothetical protein
VEREIEQRQRGVVDLVGVDSHRKPLSGFFSRHHIWDAGGGNWRQATANAAVHGERVGGCKLPRRGLLYWLILGEAWLAQALATVTALPHAWHGRTIAKDGRRPDD